MTSGYRREKLEVDERVYPHRLVGTARRNDGESWVRGSQPRPLEGGRSESGKVRNPRTCGGHFSAKTDVTLQFTVNSFSLRPLRRVAF